MRLRSRRTRALAMGAASAVLVGLASLAYLHVQIPLPRLPQPAPPPLPQLSATDFDTVMYDFVTPSLGWATDTRVSQTLAGDDLWIFGTSDGARHWKKEFHSSWQADPGARLMFFDRRHGFVYPAGPGLVDLYRTVDGGAHWTHPALPHVLVGEITFADANDGWILSDASGGDGSLPTQLFATVDGGDSWFQEPDPPQSASGAIAMRSRTEGWLGVGGGLPAVLFTADSGESWQERLLPEGAGLPSICFSSVLLMPGNGVIAIASCKGGGLSDQVESFDGGLTWSPLPTPPPDNTSWDRTTFVDSLHWWTMTGGDLWKTTDGGLTWKDYGLQINDWEYIPHALDSNHGWAQLLHTGPNMSRLSGLVMTSDGGIHWTQVNAPRP